MERSTLITLIALKLVAISLAIGNFWILAVIVFVVPDLWVLYHLFVPSAQGLCPSYTRFHTEHPEIWLTIDDGPDPVDTPRILDLLDRHQARATFFLIGERAAAAPQLVREIVRRGHEIGHHTQTHPAGTLWCASRTRLHAELDQPMKILGPLAPPLRWFRAPVGIKHFLLPHALKARGLHCIDWSLRSGDWVSRNPETVRSNVMRQVRPGSIVLMHEGPSVPTPLRLTAMTLVLEGLAQRNYRCVIPRPEQLR